jgi:hypothetical protein
MNRRHLNRRRRHQNPSRRLHRSSHEEDGGNSTHPKSYSGLCSMELTSYLGVRIERCNGGHRLDSPTRVQYRTNSRMSHQTCEPGRKAEQAMSYCDFRELLFCPHTKIWYHVIVSLGKDDTCPDLPRFRVQELQNRRQHTLRSTRPHHIC